jgi:hypothetical protein
MIYNDEDDDDDGDDDDPEFMWSYASPLLLPS